MYGADTSTIRNYPQLSVTIHPITIPITNLHLLRRALAPQLHGCDEGIARSDVGPHHARSETKSPHDFTGIHRDSPPANLTRLALRGLVVHKP